MLEAHREEMLEAMGVRILHSRFQMPGAKIPAIVPAQPDMATPGGGAISGNYAPDGKLSEVVQLEQKVAAPQAGRSLAQTLDVPEIAATSVLAAESGRPREKALRVRYRFVHVNELLMLVDQPKLEWQDAEKARPFFTDVYFALTGKKPQSWSEAEFDWPPSKQFPYANNKAMASQALQSFLQQQMEKPGCCWVLAWGDQLAESLFEQTPEVGTISFVDSAPVLVLESLQHYWQEPSKKKLLWQLLQAVNKSPVVKDRHA